MLEIKKHWAKLTPDIRKKILWALLASCVIAFYQGVSDSIDVTIKNYGCKYSSLWSYHPARWIPCEILRNRNPIPTQYIQPQKRRR